MKQHQLQVHLSLWLDWIGQILSFFTFFFLLFQKNGPGAPGGQSWTAEWLKFDNSYFKVRATFPLFFMSDDSYDFA
jgi:hypothetical protein